MKKHFQQKKRKNMKEDEGCTKSSSVTQTKQKKRSERETQSDAVFFF